MRRAYNLRFLFSLNQHLRAMAKIEELADRVERLLLRFDELSRTQQLVEAQLANVTQERDSLKSRLNAARSRIDALLDRLPKESFAADALTSEASTVETTPLSPQP
jgi:cell division protein ZapB